MLGSFLAAKPPGLPSDPKVDFEKPTEKNEIFQEADRDKPKLEPAVKPDSEKPPLSFGDNLDRIDKAEQLLELADALASSGDYARARRGYEEVSQLSPGSHFDQLAQQKLEELLVEHLTGVGETEAGLSLTSEICWHCLATASPETRLKWLDAAFAAYSKAVDEKKKKEIAIYKQMIAQISPETAENLDQLRPRDVSGTVYLRFLSVTYTKHATGKQSIGVGIGIHR